MNSALSTRVPMLDEGSETRIASSDNPESTGARSVSGPSFERT